MSEEKDRKEKTEELMKLSRDEFKELLYKKYQNPLSDAETSHDFFELLNELNKNWESYSKNRHLQIGRVLSELSKEAKEENE